MKTKKRHEDNEGATAEQLRKIRTGELSYEDVYGEEDVNDLINQVSSAEVKKFLRKQAKFGSPVRDGTYYLFRNGARLECGPHGYGIQEEAPADKYERSKLRHRFYSIKAKKAEEAFRNYQDQVLQSSIYDSTQEEQLAKLKLLRQKAVKARERLRKVKMIVKELTPQHVDAKKRIEGELRQKHSEHLRKVRGIKL